MGLILEGEVLKITDVTPQKGKPYRRLDVLVNGSSGAPRIYPVRCYLPGALSEGQQRMPVREEVWAGARGPAVTWYLAELPAAVQGGRPAGKGL